LENFHFYGKFSDRKVSFYLHEDNGGHMFSSNCRELWAEKDKRRACFLRDGEEFERMLNEIKII